MSTLNTKDAAVLSEIVYANSFYNDANRVDLSVLRGKSLSSIIFNGDEINTDIVSFSEETGSLYQNLKQNVGHYN